MPLPIPHELYRVRDPDAADFKAVRVTLFCQPGNTNSVFGWFIGPSDLVADGEAYLPASSKTIASIAVLRAIALSHTLGIRVCVIDPDDLWDRAWAT